MIKLLTIILPPLPLTDPAISPPKSSKLCEALDFWLLVIFTQWVYNYNYQNLGNFSYFLIWILAIPPYEQVVAGAAPKVSYKWVANFGPFATWEVTKWMIERILDTLLVDKLFNKSLSLKNMMWVTSSITDSEASNEVQSSELNSRSTSNVQGWRYLKSCEELKLLIAIDAAVLNVLAAH